MSKKKSVDESASKSEQGANPFEPDLTKISSEFDLESLISGYKDKLKESDQRKISLAARIEAGHKNIERITSMIRQLEMKGLQESSQTWVNAVIRPVVAEIQNSFPNAGLELAGPWGLSSAVTISLTKKGVSQAGKLKGEDCRSVTLVPVEDGIGVRDFEKDSGEYPHGSIGWMNGLNHPTVEVPKEKSIEFIISWLR